MGIPTCLETIQFYMTDATVSKGTIHVLVWEMSLRQTLKRTQTGNIRVWHGNKLSNRDNEQKMLAGETGEGTVSSPLTAENSLPVKRKRN